MPWTRTTSETAQKGRSARAAAMAAARAGPIPGSASNASGGAPFRSSGTP